MKSNDTVQPQVFSGIAHLRMKPKLYVVRGKSPSKGVAKPRVRLKLIQSIHIVNVFAQKTISGQKFSLFTRGIVHRVKASVDLRLHGSVYELPLPKDCIALRQWRLHQAK